LMMRDYGNGFFDRFRAQDYGWMVGRGLLMLLGILLVVAIVTILIVLLVRAGRQPANMHRTSIDQSVSHPSTQIGQQAEIKQALAILNERYARGEIDDDEYKRRKSQLLS